MLLDQPGQPPKQPSPVGGRNGAPAWKGAPGGLDGAIRVLGARRRHLRDRFPQWRD